MKQLLAAVGATAVMTAGILTAAGAAPALASCPSGATCSYTGINFTGSQGPVYGNNTNDRQYSTWANAESIKNNGTQCEDWIFKYENYGNPNFGIPLGYQVSNLSGTWGWHHLWSNHWCNP